MKNNGFTKIPNAIIRMADITPSERSVWFLIASLPKGYDLSIDEACAWLGINQKTWRKSISGLKMRNMITVEPVPGHTNIYTVTDAENWDVTHAKKRDVTHAKKMEYQKTAPLQENGTPAIPKNGSGTHSNNKEQLKNNIAAAREESIILQLKIYDQWAEAICMKHHIDPTRWSEKVNDFVLDMRCRNQDLTEITDIRAYFNGWITKREQNGNNNRQRSINGNGDASTVRGFKIHQA